MPTQSTPRKYEQKRRAEQQAETRLRIVEAMVALHAEVGPARTTISAIAERAGVERLTVYRHFAGEAEMLQACSAHFAAAVAPPPDPAAWAGVDDPADRLRTALLCFYSYYRRAERMLAHVHRDRPQLPALAEVMAPWDAFVAAVRHDTVAMWMAAGPADEAARARLTAVIGHALRFETWQSLAGEAALGDAAAADLMVTFANAATAAPAAAPARD